MTITLRDHEWAQLLRDGTRRLQPELLANPKDHTLMLPQWLGQGYKRNIRLERDISMTLHHYQLREDTITIGSTIQRDCFEFSFVASGKALVEGQVFNANQEVVFQNSDLPAAAVQIGRAHV